MNRLMSKPTPALLRNVPLFSDLDERDLESLAEEFNERRFSAGDKIALEGEGGLMFFVVESGELSVEIHGEPVSTMGPGASFGEIALIDRRPRTATVTAASEVKAYGPPVFVFRPFVESRPAVAWKMLESMADRLALAELRRRNPRARILRAKILKASASRPHRATRRPSVVELSRSVSAFARSPDRLTVSVPATGSTTRPPNTTQRTPAAAHRRATSPGAFPSAVVRST